MVLAKSVLNTSDHPPTEEAALNQTAHHSSTLMAHAAPVKTITTGMKPPKSVLQPNVHPQEKES
jgi:hypothetical protein